jgi:hypothetical protein
METYEAAALGVSTWTAWLACGFMGEGVGEWITIGAEVDDGTVKGRAVNDCGAERGSVKVLVQPETDSFDAIVMDFSSSLRRGPGTGVRRRGASWRPPTRAEAEQGPHHGFVPGGAAFVLLQSYGSRLENSSAVIGVENIG